jgi:predicted kinase
MGSKQKSSTISSKVLDKPFKYDYTGKGWKGPVHLRPISGNPTRHLSVLPGLISLDNNAGASSAGDPTGKMVGDRRETATVHTGSTFILMRGYPGTGKSTIARLLAAALHAPLIDRDIIRQVAVDVFGNLPRVGQFSYELMFALTREQLGLGLSVVVDTPLTYRTTFEQAQKLARTFHTPLLVVHCQCPPEVQKRRLEGRKGKVSEFQITSWEEWEQWKPRFEEFDDEGCIIDTTKPLDESLAKVMRSIHELHRRYSFHSEQEIPDQPRI